MNQRRIALAAALCLAVISPFTPAFGETDSVTTLLRLMPADLPVAIVVVDFEKTDRSLTAIRKRLDPTGTDPGIVAGLKNELPIADWVDFGKPVGLGAPSLEGGNQGFLWARIPDFTAKVRTLAGATQEGDVWQLPFDDNDMFFATVKGEYVVAAPTKEMLAAATKDGKTLADDMKLPMDLLRDRDALIHLNIDPVRQMALGTLAQASMMAPGLAMMAGQQGGTDPATVTGMLTSILDAAKAFTEQVAYVDVAVGLTENAVDLTIATGYRDGPIKSYLAAQKPASVPLLTGLEEQPYILAAGYHIPGDASPFLDYIFGKAAGAMVTAPTAGMGETAGQPGTADQTKATKEALDIACKLYGGIRAMNVVASLSPSGVRVSGDYVGKDPKALLELTKESITTSNALAQQSGAKYEALGATKIGNVMVEQFTIALDSTNPAAATITKIYGKDPRFALGIAGDHIRFCFGDDSFVQRFFNGKVEKPFAAGRYVADALASLPAKRNAVVLIDPAGLLPLFGPMMGLTATDAIPPGPPIAISASLAGEPARLDIHVPLRAIERLTQARGSDGPM